MDELIRHINNHGPVPFSAFMDAALYGPTGFYTRGGGAGRRRDFLTSPEVGELFGRVLGRALDTWWDDLGRPDPFLVAECGAGPGALARTLRRALLRCAPALRYVLVERSPQMQQRQRENRLPFVELTELLGGMSAGSSADHDEIAPERGQGPLFAQATELPAIGVHVVLANELLDNLVIDVIERRDGTWHEVRVGLHDGAFVEQLVPLDGRDATLVARRVGEGPLPDGRLPWMAGAAEWLRGALDALVPGGTLLCIDYARPTTTEYLALPPGDWLRTYRDHGRGDAPLLEPGSSDITADVALDQLAAVRMPRRVRSQAEFLRAHGIDELVEAGRVQWLAAAARPTLADLAAASLVGEADALLDPQGLGGFTAIEWVR